MKKRRLTLDKEVLTSNGERSVDGAIWWKILETISIVVSVASALEPPFCDCLDTDSCASDRCSENTCNTCNETCPWSCAISCDADPMCI